LTPLKAALGGSLKGRRVLDLGCNAGYFSLQALEWGCDFVLGLDGREMHVDQANFVFETKGIDPERYEFVTGDVNSMDLSSWGPFDVVLCLGLLYHISDPASLINRIAGLNLKILVIDTTLVPLPGRFLQLHQEHATDPRFAVRDQFVTIPTRLAVITLAEAVGYAVAPLRPAFTSYEAALDYKAARRRAFLCSKDPQALAAIDRYTERVNPVRDAWTAARWGFHLAGRALRSHGILSGQPPSERS
jgi:SAM-dependent methyltransferase